MGRNRTLARLSHRFYWSGMSDDVKEWLGQCVVCVKRKSTNWTTSSAGQCPDWSSLGSYRDGYPGRQHNDQDVSIAIRGGSSTMD